MLEVKGLTKIYRPKRGVPVTALDSVSISFPEKGMVFLLGKSGCGKSTLLNLLGGLDSFDAGEITIAGSSCAAFRQSDFDSYRNTLVGFIFQEYNVLDEFTVGANVALALELQGKKASDEAINAILDQVDLNGYGARRPNELSGGQKQRVAIARALVKNPKIIMADEPTGALDSVTGRAVLDTLKKLSEEKLVIVVSHDREFAMRYADRIVELADGKVISDEEFVSEELTEQKIRYGEDSITLSAGYRLTEEDRLQINAYLDALAEGKTVALKAAEGVHRKSRKTQSSAPKPASAPLSMIPSRLPMKVAFRIGSGALKFKKFRLAMTILLSCIAFGLFGLADTFGAYDHITTLTNSILDSKISYASFVQEERVKEEYSDYEYTVRRKITPEEKEKLERETGIPTSGVYIPSMGSMGLYDLFDPESDGLKTEFSIYADALNGFCEIDQSTLDRMGLSLVAGRLPDGNKNEIVLTEYVYESFHIAGCREITPDGKIRYASVETPQDLLGKTIPLLERDYTVVGILQSSFDFDRYRSLAELDSEAMDSADLLLSFALSQELRDLTLYSLEQVALVGKGAVDRMIRDLPTVYPCDRGHYELILTDADQNEFYLGTGQIGSPKSIGNNKIHWLDGKERQSLSDQEIVLSLYDVFYRLPLKWEEDPSHLFDPQTGTLDPTRFTDADWSDLQKALSRLSLRSVLYSYYDGKEGTENGVSVVGILYSDVSPKQNEQLGEIILVSDSNLAKLTQWDDGLYTHLVGKMPTQRAEVRALAEYCNSDEPLSFALQNSVTFELDTLHELFVVLADVFLYVGIAFAVFAALMLANFIGTSVVYKKQQIGILRAIGARSNDVFRIFFSEAFVIAMINFLLSAIGTFLAVVGINTLFREETGILVTPLAFTIRQVGLLFAVSLAVAALSSFFPVKKIAAKKPIDAIRNH